MKMSAILPGELKIENTMVLKTTMDLIMESEVTNKDAKAATKRSG